MIFAVHIYIYIHIYFQLLWVILIGLIFALIIQSLAANLGVSTGKLQECYYNPNPPELFNTELLIFNMVLVDDESGEVDATVLQRITDFWSIKLICREALVGAMQDGVPESGQVLPVAAC